MKRASIVLWVAIWGYVGYLVYDWVQTPPKPKELTPLDLSNILTEKVNKLNSQIRAAEKRIETLERLQAGELPQIHGGKTYEKDSIEND